MIENLSAASCRHIVEPVAYEILGCLHACYATKFIESFEVGTRPVESFNSPRNRSSGLIHNQSYGNIHKVVS
jgi:hypothetical protein